MYDVQFEVVTVAKMMGIRMAMMAVIIGRCITYLKEKVSLRICVPLPKTRKKRSVYGYACYCQREKGGGNGGGSHTWWEVLFKGHLLLDLKA